MFGLGFFEIILILIGILIFIRPQDLPAFVYRVGKIYGQIKEAYNKFYREINIIKNQMDDIVEKQKLNEKKDDTPSPLQSPTPLQEIMPFTRPEPKIEKKSSEKSKSPAQSPAARKAIKKKVTPKKKVTQPQPQSATLQKKLKGKTVKGSPRGQKKSSKSSKLSKSKPRLKNTPGK